MEASKQARKKERQRDTFTDKRNAKKKKLNNEARTKRKRKKRISSNIYCGWEGLHLYTKYVEI